MKDTFTVKFYSGAQSKAVSAALKALKTIDKSDLKAPALPSMDEECRGACCLFCGKVKPHYTLEDCPVLGPIIARAEARQESDNPAGTIVLESAA